MTKRKKPVPKKIRIPAPKKKKSVEHMVIPDTQVHDGVPTNHLRAAGNYAAERRPDVIIHIGDHWDMPSLSSYERPGSKFFEGKRYAHDVGAGNAAMEEFLEPIRRQRGYKPRLVFCFGNHEQRIERAVNSDPVKFEGVIGYDDLNLGAWEVHPFLQPVEIDGILYCHYFVNQQSALKGVLGGTIDNRLNKIKQSFTQGHQQTRLWGTQFTSSGREICGLVAGAFYQHDEDYLGPQGNHYWRGIVYKHEVIAGRYDPMFVSLEYLLREYA